MKGTESKILEMTQKYSVELEQSRRTIEKLGMQNKSLEQEATKYQNSLSELKERERRIEMLSNEI